MTRESVKILKGALDKGEDGRIILRGVVDPASLRLLNRPDYQREVLPSQVRDLLEAMKAGERVPDIEVGMRGASHHVREGVFYLQDPVYIIDGLQRVTAGIEFSARGGEPHIGVAVHFGTDEKWERVRFKTVNVDRTRLSANILLRNLKEENAAVEMLYKLTDDKSFAMSGRVCWDQRKRVEHLVSARTYLRTIARLHGRFGPVGGHSLDETAKSLQNMMQKIGRSTMRDNVVFFFNVIEQAFRIKAITIKEGSTHMRDNFLHMLARFFASHQIFWRENRLFVDVDTIRKIGQFDSHDPEISRLASAGSSAIDMLYFRFFNHVNSGRRTNRLVEDGIESAAIPGKNGKSTTVTADA